MNVAASYLCVLICFIPRLQLVVVSLALFISLYVNSLINAEIG